MSADHIPSHATSFGSLLRRYRAAAGLTQEALASRAGLSTRAISDLERGLKQAPRRETVRMLAEALGLTPPKRALLEMAVRPMAIVPRREEVAAAPHNLPAQPDELIGRERETLVGADLLARVDVRVLTITGPGGVGKTRLALRVAEDVLGQFDDGVYVTMLAALRDPDLVMQSIAGTLGVRATAGEPVAKRLHAHLRDKEMLLVLDNFEHLLAAAGQVSSLLAACPRVKVLVTSRAPLRIGGEHEMPVAPLARGAAVDLFVLRARASNPGLQLRDDDFQVAEAICERLDRLPLAIELAAVWTKVLSLPALLDQLAHSLERLTSGRRDAPERQRSLRDTIAWSERLLGQVEQRLFHQLAIFSGDCTAEAVATICFGQVENGEQAQASPLASLHAGEGSATERHEAQAIEHLVERDTEKQASEGIDAGRALDVLANLVEQALVETETYQDGRGTTRFWMLETIREYALERLRASGEAEVIAQRHAEYYARLVRELPWGGAEQDARDRRIEREMPNIRAALEWVWQRREPGMGLQLATALGLFWYSRGAFDEGERWLRAFLALDAGGEEHVPARLRVMALYFLTLFALDRHDFERGEALAREGLELARQHGDMSGAGNMLTELGHVAEARGDLDGAMRLYEESLAQYRAGGASGSIGRVLSSLGNVARTRGDYEQARRYLDESLAWARERRFSWAVASVLVGLGHLACEQGDFARAGGLYRESLEFYRTLRNPTALAWCLQGVVVVLAARGEHERAARLCGAVARLYQTAEAAAEAEWQPFARACMEARRSLGEEWFTEARRAGETLALEQIVAFAVASVDAERR